MATSSAFLSECSRTAGWNKDRGVSMSESLHDLVSKMIKDENLRQRCLAIADSTFIDFNCGDRIGISYVNMILAKNNAQKQISEMSESEFFEYAKQDAVLSYLEKEACQKIEYLKKQGGALDEIEVRLAYLQVAPRLGINLPNSEMLYQRCSNVNDAELDEVVNQFNSCASDPNAALFRRIAERIYDSDELKTFGEIRQRIDEESNKDQNDVDQSKYPDSKSYHEALKEAESRIIEAVKVLVIRYSGLGIALDDLRIEVPEVSREGENTSGNNIPPVSEAAPDVNTSQNTNNTTASNTNSNPPSTTTQRRSTTPVFPRVNSNDNFPQQ